MTGPSARSGPAPTLPRRRPCWPASVACGPCPAARGVTAAQYAAVAQRAGALIDGRDNSALAAAVHQITALVENCRYESAARLRDHTAAAVEILWRGQRLRALAAVPELIAA